ncbi:hypothetical protein jhhlp_003087 [Lomentospora prolificans]|uniref:lytic cellulose monooxygenase (C4-dehydrogenating) n=1 Tax=Lomentospora prolificans TaxID=41688 RepID=A0A2N3NFX3_9PEZI|nr:hypothetical protein jhhlp_003087 [Lomentospora prolificans]
MPSLSITAAAAALFGAATVAAHGHVTHVITSDGVEHQGWDPTSGMGYGNNFPDVVGWTTTVQDNGFISKESHGNFEMACHRGATPAALSVTVQAGDVVTLAWDTWPVSHHGPVLDYLAACGSAGCASADKTELSWFKISEVGNVTPGTGDNGVWGADLLINNGVKWQVQIPDFIAPGEYVLRHEIIALHSLGEPQHYPQCINLVIEGNGSTTPEGVLANALYTDYEDFNIYQPFNSYPIPGPAMIEGASPILDQGSGTPAPGNNSGEDGSGSDNGSAPTEPAPSATATPTTPAPGNNAEEGSGDEETVIPTVPEEPAETSAPATPTRRPCSRRRRRRSQY